MTGLEVFLMIGTIGSWVSTGVIIAKQVIINRLQSKINNCQQKINDYYEQRINEIDRDNDNFNVDDVEIEMDSKNNNFVMRDIYSIQIREAYKNNNKNSNEV